MLNRCENLSKLELYTFVARVGISSILIFGPHKTIAEHSYVQLRPGICTVTQSGMLTPPAVFIYTRITHLTQACRTLSRSSFITTSWCNHLANYRILLCPEVFIEPQSSTNNMQMICTKCRALGVFLQDASAANIISLQLLPSMRGTLYTGMSLATSNIWINESKEHGHHDPFNTIISRHGKF
jgi:hypothetical protein